MWNKCQPIQFSDFRGKVPTNNKHDASINTHIKINPYDSTKYIIAAVMRCNYSWTTTKSPYVLKHEQYHFNIAELFARKLRKQIVELKIKIPSSTFYYTYNEQLNNCLDFHAKYDSVTEHSIKKAQQLLWQKNIDAELAALEEYKNPIIAK